ncbi:MAG: hypothetical protein K8L91_11970 [Anaerolineae bacterium]|nr:hypothetical protein [Anaerolineae bacterium]
MYSKVVHEHLIQVARTSDDWVTYKEVIDFAGLRLIGDALSGALGRVFYEVVQEDLAQDATRPMLSSIALPVGGSRPSKGFFDLARELGRLKSNNPDIEDEFWLGEVKALRAYWQNRE